VTEAVAGCFLEVHCNISECSRLCVAQQLTLAPFVGLPSQQSILFANHLFWLCCCCMQVAKPPSQRQ